MKEDFIINIKVLTVCLAMAIFAAASMLSPEFWMRFIAMIILLVLIRIFVVQN